MPVIYEAHGDFDARVVVWKATEPLEFFVEHCQMKDEDAGFLASLHPRRALEWAATRYVLRRLTGARTDHMYLKDRFGKPYLSNDPREISITHSHGAVGVIIANVAVGIDVQIRTEKIYRIRHKFLGPSEAEKVHSADDARLIDICWSAKEALFKTYARGEVDFRKHLFVDLPDRASESGVLQGRLIKPGERLECRLHYRFIDDYTLVYAIPE